MLGDRVGDGGFFLLVFEVVQVDLQESQIGRGAESDGRLNRFDLHLRLDLFGERPRLRHEQVERLGRHVGRPVTPGRNFIEGALGPGLGPLEPGVHCRVEQFEQGNRSLLVVGFAQPGGGLAQLGGNGRGPTFQLGQADRVHTAGGGRNQRVDERVFFFRHCGFCY